MKGMLAESVEGSMDGLIEQLPRLFTDLDVFLTEVVEGAGLWAYALLFLIIFCETGLVILPFLPGDSLLFAVGAICARRIGLDPWICGAVIFIAAVLGDFVNYQIGKWIGPRAFSGKIPLLRVAHLERTREFFVRHGPKAVVLARFVPIVRTFAPFFAGIGVMRFRTFQFYNVAGALLWVVLLVGAGFLFGEIPIIKRNFETVVIAIVIVSVLPIVIEWWRMRRQSREVDRMKNP
ncbi:MAG: DedA family protein [Planctomycetota bacterium]|nr:DedA family protein [Planctomycetota bacterium]MDA1261300.1 DedA family protein [Planctomycetota bacterium]